MLQDYTTQITQLVQDDRTFVRLVLKTPLPGTGNPWRQVTVRPVLLKGGRHLQFSYLSQKQDITKNYRGGEAESRLAEALTLPFASIAVHSTTGERLFQVRQDGRAILHRRAATAEVAPEVAHDARKQLALPAGRPDAFLQTVGVMDEQGRIRAGMHDKFVQVNELLKLLIHTGELEHLTGPVVILDCGCGSAYLSFALYHYLSDIRQMSTSLVGIDTNEMLVRKNNEQSAQSGFAGARFEHSSILAYRPQVVPDIVLALHACDTATDEALWQGVVGRAPLILCAPCCHHHLQQQLHAVAPLGPLLRDGILKRRLGDLLTDTFRALLLRILGYRTDIVEFVAPEHTDKNLLIRAVRRGPLPDTSARDEYLALKSFWGVTPYLETLLSEELAPYLASCAQG
ncbi:MAG TPA: SAM-dependent methyltransferase [Ktedonobacteraceae bacterium]|jgi:SAM-dependent methyltransferase